MLGLVVALLPLAGCLPDNPHWASGQPVHPQFIGASDRGPCVAGMAYDLTEKILTYRDAIAEGGDNLEWWFEFGNGLANDSFDTAMCWRAIFGPREIFWTCGLGQVHSFDEVPLQPNPDAYRFFRLCWLCTSDGRATYLGNQHCQGAQIILQAPDPTKTVTS
jgi:hypothetical protein